MTRETALTSASSTAMTPPAPGVYVGDAVDVVAWITAVLRNPETGLPFDLLPAEIAFLEHAFQLNEDGSAKYPELVYSAPKKSGKTAFAAILTLVIVLLFGGHDPEALVCANDLDQSSTRVFSAIKKIVKASPKLRKRAKIFKTEILFPETGATITAIANDAAGAAGSNSVVSTFDELWGYVSESSHRLWDECVPPPTRKAAWRVTSTYAGFANESRLLQDLYNRGIAQPLVAPDLYAGDGILCFWTHSPVAPWQTLRWYAQMRQQMRPNQFARMIENRWVTSESSFIEMATWDACVDANMAPLAADQHLPVFVAVDASLKRDSTAIVVVTSDGERVRLVTHRVFQPSPDAPLDFEATIEATIIELCASFSVQAVRYDPWQMASVAQRLIRRGVPMQEFAQTTSNLTDASSNLYELITGCSLSVYPDDAMRLSVSQAIAVETPRGWRIAKEKARHKIDVVVALGMACHAAIKQKPIAGWGMLEHYRRLSEASAAQPAVPTLLQEHVVAPVMQIGTRPARPDDYVRVLAPVGLEASNLTGGASGKTYLAEIEENVQRVFWLSEADALAIVGSPRSPDWFEANAELRSVLQQKYGNSRPPPWVGLRWADVIPQPQATSKAEIWRQTAEMARRVR